MQNAAPNESTLDPADWENFRQLAHRMLDDMLDHSRTLRERPAWQPMPDGSKDRLRQPLPTQGRAAEEVYDLFRDHVLPYTNGNRHPGFVGWVQGNGTPLAMMAEMLAAGMNPHCAGFEQASTYVETQALEWLREIMGFPEGSSGLLVSGGTMANFVGLAAARDSGAGGSIRYQGMQRSSPDPLLTYYVSEEIHGWASKSAHLLGLGEASRRTIRADDQQQMRIDELETCIRADRAAGHQPFCVIGTAGTINTGAIDDLEALADLCQRDGLWFHVDGAFGAWARLSSTHRERVRGIERADSLAFDLHKWGYLPFEVACVLVRDGNAHRAPFSIQGGYLKPQERGVSSAGLPFAERGLELTRDFKALKVWMSLLVHGTDTLGTVIDQNIQQADRLRQALEQDPLFELLAPVALNVVCFRAAPRQVPEAAWDELNHELLMTVQESGVGVPSGTTFHGRFALRAAFTNHRTRISDVDTLARRLAEIARTLSEG